MAKGSDRLKYTSMLAFNREKGEGSWTLNTTVYLLSDFSLTGFFLLP